MATTPAWRQALRQASFRGVPFYVDSRGIDTGRRTATHEFPHRDMPYLEDLGRKARVFVVEAYVLGSDYMVSRDALLTACEKAGSGRLILPWSGDIVAMCTGCTVRETKTDGGMATFSLTFAESGEAATPTVSVSQSLCASSFADSVQALADAKLDASLVLDGVSAPVLEDTLEAMVELTESIASIRTLASDALALANSIAIIVDMTVDTVNTVTPSTLLHGLFCDDEDDLATSDVDQASRSLEMLDLAEAAPTVTVPTDAGTIRTAQATNRAVLATYQRETAMTEAARSAAYASPSSKAEASTLREAICDAMDDILDITKDDSLFMALTDLRVATVRALVEAGGKAPDIMTISPPIVLPSLVIAHRANSSAVLTTETDLLARNAVRHPAFVPADSLEVLRG